MASSKSAQFVKAIREGDSDDLSLAGFDMKQVTLLVNDAFSAPIPATEMIRFIFTVGGGKNVRSKYDANLPRDMSSALREIDYSEDRSASCTVDCQGTFKFQHNTDTDLKTITVFPLVTIQEGKAETGASWMVEEMNVLSTKPELIATYCTMLTFVQLVVELCPTFSQRSALLMAMKGVQQRIEAVEAKLANREPLEEEEEDLYANADSLGDKVQALQSQTQNMVTEGLLTNAEREEVIDRMSAKLQVLLQTEAKLDKKVAKESKKEKKSKKKGSKGVSKAAKKLSKIREHLLSVNDTIQQLENSRPPPAPAPRRGRRGQQQPTGPPATPYQRKLDKELASLYKRRDASFTVAAELEHEIEVLEFKRGGWYADSRKY